MFGNAQWNKSTNEDTRNPDANTSNKSSVFLDFIHHPSVPALNSWAHLRSWPQSDHRNRNPCRTCSTRIFLEQHEFWRLCTSVCFRVRGLSSRDPLRQSKTRHFAKSNYACLYVLKDWNASGLYKYKPKLTICCHHQVILNQTLFIKLLLDPKVCVT